MFSVVSNSCIQLRLLSLNNDNYNDNCTTITKSRNVEHRVESVCAEESRGKSMNTEESWGIVGNIGESRECRGLLGNTGVLYSKKSGQIYSFLKLF